MKINKIITILFFALITVMPLLTFSLPADTHSELENRDLQKMPELTLNSVKNKTFMEDFEKYMADHMVGRSFFVKAKTKIELLSGKKEINGVFIDERRLMENVSAASDERSRAAVDAINQFAEKYGNKASVYAALIPSASEIYSESLPAFAEPLDQAEYIRDFYGQLENVTTFDIYSSLLSNKDSYIYYRTDHHWTSYGAYIGYTAMGRPLGFKAAAADTFNIEHASHDFLGTLYSKVLYGEHLADSIDIYHYAPAELVDEVVKVTNRNSLSYPSVFFKENLDVKDKYTVFLGGNDAVVKIKTKVNNGNKLLLFKDSYSNSLMQFLPLHYEEIVLVDLRYLNLPLDEYIDLRDYSQVMFLYSVAALNDDIGLRKLSVLS